MKVARPIVSIAVATLFAINMLAVAQTGVTRQQPTDSPAYALTTRANTGTRSAVFASPARPIGKGAARAWVTLDPNGHPTAIGVTFDEAALDGLPMDIPHGQHGTEYVLAMPPEASATPFDHVGVNWNPHGHEPSTIYDVGHFDFHFYMIGQQERARITAQGDDLE